MLKKVDISLYIFAKYFYIRIPMVGLGDELS